MENHHFLWENQLLMAIFNSYVKLPEGNSHASKIHVSPQNGTIQRKVSSHPWFGSDKKWNSAQHRHLPGRCLPSRWNHPVIWGCFPGRFGNPGEVDIKSYHEGYNHRCRGLKPQELV